MPLRDTAPKLSPEQYEKNFADITPPMSKRQAAIEAARCLYCFDAPCTIACPTHIDVPAFIKKISTGNLRGSAREILVRQYPGAELRPRVPHRSALRRRLRDARKRRRSRSRSAACSATPWITCSTAKIELFHAGAPNGKRVACIGSGPASLACAAELAKWGYDVTIFDRNELPGGLNTYGIAAYKSRAAETVREVELIKQLGVKFRQKMEVGARCLLRGSRKAI